MLMTPVIFWDQDTQHDFMDPQGKLYVPGAEHIVTQLERLTRFARQHGVQIIALMDDHTEADAEISSQPDFQHTFPPHCMRGTRGQERIAATAPQAPLFVENRRYAHSELEGLLRGHHGEIVIKKQALDPFTNPATAVVLDLLAPHTVIVYGVATEFCVHRAIMGLSDRTRRVCFVRDASQPVNAQAAKRCETEWRQRGVEIVTAADVVEQRVVQIGPARAAD
ncbi:MAG: cysteine hydrolase family protein [Candidatus Binatia bacterium]